MNFERASGILLHPTSLPGRFGIGDLGQEAYNFVHFLQNAGQRLWQIMPLGPTGYGDSPYASFSAFAGNPLLISPDKLIEEGLLPENALDDLPAFPINFIDYGWVIHVKFELLQSSFVHFTENQPAA
ncbi:4-alpha-glucanotransferase, partial [bacterium]|nr:4-alpha-glucanotransferase [bacterium]